MLNIISNEYFLLILSLVALSPIFYAYSFSIRNNLKFLKHNCYLGLTFFIKVLLAIYAISLSSSKNDFLVDRQYFILIDVICSFLSAFFILKIYNYKNKYSLVYLFSGLIIFSLLLIFLKNDIFFSFVFTSFFYFYSIILINNFSFYQKKNSILIILNNINYLNIFLVLQILSLAIFSFFTFNYYILFFIQFVSYIFLSFYTEKMIDFKRISKNEEIKEILDEKKKISNLIQNISQKLAHTEKLEDIVPLINDSACRAALAEASIIWLLDEKENKFITAAVSGIYPPLFPAKRYILSSNIRLMNKVFKDKFTFGETYAGKVAQSQKELYLTENINEKIEDTTEGIFPIYDIICIPVILNNKTIGLMSVINKNIANKKFNHSDFL